MEVHTCYGKPTFSAILSDEVDLYDLVVLVGSNRVWFRSER